MNTRILGIVLYPFDVPLAALLVAFALSDQRFPLNSHEASAAGLLALFALWVIITSAFSIDPMRSFSEGLLWLRAAILFGILTATYGFWYDIRDVSLAALALLLFQGSLALVQAIFQTSFGQLNQYFGTGEVIQSYDTIGGREVLRSQGTLSNPNTLSNWIALLFPLSLLAVANLRERWSLALAGICSLGLASLIVTQSRGTLVIFVVSFIVVTLFLFRRQHLSWLGGAGIVVIIVSFLPGADELPYLERFFALTDGGSTRLLGILESVAVIVEYPLTGTGYDVYNLGADAAGATIAGSPTTVHHIPLLMTAETGLFGGLLFLGFLVFSVRPILTALNRGCPRRAGIVYGFIAIVLLGTMSLYTAAASFQFVPLYVAVLASGVSICSTEKP